VSVFRRAVVAADRAAAWPRRLLAVPVGYLTLLTAAAWVATARRRPRPARRGDATTRFAILIPAHNEELALPDTLASLRALDYPADAVRVHVVADHCTDATAEVAAAGGAVVHPHEGPERGKARALAWALERILAADADPVDVVVIVDADTVVDRAALRAFDAVFADGARVAQGHYAVRHPEGSTAAALRAAALAVRHHLRPLGRNELGASAGLYGNGMAFRAELLRERTWTEHLTEDMEFQLRLVLDGVDVVYVPEARIEAEMPETLEAATTQNERWERGRVDLARRYVPQLLRRLVRPGRANRVAVADALLDATVPPLSVLTAATVSVTAGSVVLRRARRAPGWPGVGLCVALVAHVASGLALARVPWSVVRSLAAAPRLVVWKTALFLRVAKRPEESEWIRTERNAERRRAEAG
jgi:cellulose synthase/poly-beta-1,6-N-acetylglucosamine synthase-like glycosyltransferase